MIVTNTRGQQQRINCRTTRTTAGIMDVGSVVGLLFVGEACDVILVVGVVVGSCVGLFDVRYVVPFSSSCSS